MLNKAYICIVIFYLAFQANILGQVVTEDRSTTTPTDSIITNPIINYTATPKKYTIEDIKVTGLEGTMYEEQDFVMINFSGLSVGQEVQIPGDDITDAVSKFWKQGLFSDVKILVDKIQGNKVWLEIKLTGRPRISDIHYSGMKKSEREDIEKKVGMVKGNQ